MYKVLVPETRIDGHYQDLVHIRQNFFEHDCGRRGVYCYTRALSQPLDSLHCAMQIVVAFPMDEKRIGSCVNKLVEKNVRVSDHHVYLKLQICNPSERLDDWCTHRDVRHKVSIHDIDVNSISPGTLR